jgi:hypothetical protein
MFVQVAVPEQPHACEMLSLFDHEVVDLDGLQIWQLPSPCVNPDDLKLFPIQQPDRQLPPLHTLEPEPHEAPSPCGLHVPVEQVLHSPHVVLQQIPEIQFPFLH